MSMKSLHMNAHKYFHTKVLNLKMYKHIKFCRSTCFEKHVGTYILSCKISSQLHIVIPNSV